MGEMMTLGEVRSTLDEWGCSSLGQVQMSTSLLRKMRDAIDAHLATPAQTVDIEAVREVIAEMRHPTKQNFVSEWADKLTAALTEKGK